MFYDYLFPTVVLKDYNVLKNPQKILGAIGTERHSTPYIHKEEKFKELADKVLEYSNEYAKNMKWDTELYIVSMWYNSMKQYEDHRPHSHGNSLLSGVYYPTGTPSHRSIHTDSDLTPTRRELLSHTERVAKATAHRDRFRQAIKRQWERATPEASARNKSVQDKGKSVVY